jgi:hypothetical protein
VNTAANLLAPIYDQAARLREIDPLTVVDALDAIRLTDFGAGLDGLTEIEQWLYTLGEAAIRQAVRNRLDQITAESLAAQHGGEPSDYLPVSA